MKQLKQRSCALALLLSITVLLSGCDSGTGAVTSTAATSQPKQVEEVESTPALQETESTVDAQETASTPSAADPEAAYCDVLDMIYTSISCGWTNCDQDGYGDVSDPDDILPSIDTAGMSGLSLSEMGYQLLDLNNDGQPELLISSLELAKSGNFTDLYTIANGEITHPILTPGREFYSLAEDHSINLVSNSGAMVWSYSNYQFSNTDAPLTLNRIIGYDAYLESDSPYYYATENCFMNGDYNYDVLTPISESEANTMIDDLPQDIPLELTPFSEYTPTTSNP